jgi:hypothetical protein
MSLKKFTSVTELQEKIDKYFLDCDTNKKPYTISGLALFLGATRQTLLNYEDKDEYFATIREAKQKCEVYAEESLWTPRIASGVIFNMTNNYKWKDKSEVEIAGQLSSFTNALADIVLQYVPEDKRDEASNKLKAAFRS